MVYNIKGSKTYCRFKLAVGRAVDVRDAIQTITVPTYDTVGLQAENRSGVTQIFTGTSATLKANIRGVCCVGRYVPQQSRTTPSPLLLKPLA